MELIKTNYIDKKLKSRVDSMKCMSFKMTMTMN